MSDEKRKSRYSLSQTSAAKKRKEIKPSEKRASEGVEKPSKYGRKTVIPIEATSRCHKEEVDSGASSENMKGSNTNHIKFLNQFQKGFGKLSTFEQIREQMYLRDLRWCKIAAKVETSELRVTAMQWHPHNPNFLVSGDKLGTVHLYDVKKPSDEKEVSFNRNTPICFCGVQYCCFQESSYRLLIVN
uniref:Damage-specific DNA-binding protein 2 n=1 Tax=Graphocephala atropunctata TaxID=36148 RepID=A0A1B6KSR0_9HEMI